MAGTGFWDASDFPPDYPQELIYLYNDLKDAIQKLFTRFQSGEISLVEWRLLMQDLLAEKKALAVITGANHEILTENETQHLEEGLTRQYDWLDDFYQNIQGVLEGEPPKKDPNTGQPVYPWDQWMNRAGLYAGSVIEDYWYGEFAEWPLPAMPGDGSSQCLQWDRCQWKLDVLDPEHGDANAFWVLDPGAEHCQTCLERAAAWNPLKIRGWELILPDYDLMMGVKEAVLETLKGGPGSGNLGHAGIPGHQGGSAPAGDNRPKWIQDKEAQARKRKEEGAAIADYWRKKGFEMMYPDDGTGEDSMFVYEDGSTFGNAVDNHTDLAWQAQAALGMPQNEIINGRKVTTMQKMNERGFVRLGVNWKSMAVQALKVTPKQFRVIKDAWQYLKEAMEGAGYEADFIAELNGAVFNDFDSFRRAYTKSTLKEAFTLALKGGPGSGNFSHSGRPGKIGGSAARSGTWQPKLTGAILGVKKKLPKPPKPPIPQEDQDDLDLIKDNTGGKLHSTNNLNKLFRTKIINEGNDGFGDTFSVSREGKIRTVMLPDGSFLSLSSEDMSYHTPIYAAYILNNKPFFSEEMIEHARDIMESNTMESSRLEEAVKSISGGVSIEEQYIGRPHSYKKPQRNLIIEAVTDADVGEMNRVLKMIKSAIKRGDIDVSRYDSFIFDGGGRQILIMSGEIEDVSAITKFEDGWSFRSKDLKRDISRVLMLALKGGPGSGNYGHVGRIGEVGGSAPRTGITKVINDPDFDRWFSGSKVVDKEGRPLVVFHGTRKGGFTVFDIQKADPDALYGPGFYFTQDPEIGSSYAKPPNAIKTLTRDFTSEEKAKILVDLAGLVNDEGGDKVKRLMARFIMGMYAEDPANGFKKLIDDSLDDPSLPHREYLMDWARKFEIPLAKEPGPQVIPAFLKITKPFDIDHVLDKSERKTWFNRLNKLYKELEGFGYITKYGYSSNHLMNWIETHFQDFYPKAYGKNARGERLTGEDIFKELSFLYEDGSSDGKEEAVRLLKDWGFDGITHLGGKVTGGKRHRVWIVFDSTQIKSSIPNQGDYSPNPDILKEALVSALKGGAGSGNFHHAGRPGKVGGSASQGAGGKMKIWPEGVNPMDYSQGKIPGLKLGKRNFELPAFVNPKQFREAMLKTLGSLEDQRQELIGLRERGNQHLKEVTDKLDDEINSLPDDSPIRKSRAAWEQAKEAQKLKIKIVTDQWAESHRSIDREISALEDQMTAEVIRGLKSGNQDQPRLDVAGEMLGKDVKAAQAQKAIDGVFSILSPEIASQIIKKEHLVTVERAFETTSLYNIEKGTIELAHQELIPEEAFRHAVHELGHWLDNRIPGALKRLALFRKDRTQGQKFENYDDVSDMPCKPDKFYKRYMGVWYQGQIGTEIFSKGIEALFTGNAVDFARKDPETFDLVLSILRGL